jgi:hypothetical protein
METLLHRLLLVPNALYTLTNILTERIKHGHNISVLLDGLDVPTPGCLIGGGVKGRSHSREIGLLVDIHHKKKKRDACQSCRRGPGRRCRVWSLFNARVDVFPKTKQTPLA